MTSSQPSSGAPLDGLFAAIVTPREAGGDVALDTFDRLLDFVLDRGVRGVCLGGATAEYPHWDAATRRALVSRAAARLPADRILLVAIGAATRRDTLDLGAAALDAGARALLVPMPGFFRYQQDDLEAYCAEVASALAAPCLLYDLPAFTTPLEPVTALRLLATHPHIVGLKDSSGRRENLRHYAVARGDRPWTLLVGDDAAISEGREAGWNGAISGLAGLCPELLVRLDAEWTAGDRDGAAGSQALLDELIDRLGPFPAPWGIRIGLAARGFDTGPLPLPLSATRRTQAAEVQAWLPGWLERAGIAPAVGVRS